MKTITTTIYASMKQHSKTRNHEDLPFTKDQFIEWFWKQKGIENLMNQWKRSNYSKWLKPSVDRINNSKGYYFPNMRIVTFSENHYKQTLFKSCPVEQLDDSGNVLAIYPSINNARRVVGINRTGIGRAISKNTKAGGYYWRLYKKENHR